MNRVKRGGVVMEVIGRRLWRYRSQPKGHTMSPSSRPTPGRNPAGSAHDLTGDTPVASYWRDDTDPTPPWRYFFDPRRASGVGTLGSILLWGGLLFWRVQVVMAEFAAGKPVTAYSELFTTGGLMFLGFVATMALGFVIDLVISHDRDRDAMQSVERAFAESVLVVRELKRDVRQLNERFEQHAANTPDVSRCGELAETARGIVDRTTVDVTSKIPFDQLRLDFYKSVRDFLARIRNLPHQSMSFMAEEAAVVDAHLVQSATSVLLATTYVTGPSLEFWFNESHPLGMPYWAAYLAQRAKNPQLRCVRIFVVARPLTAIEQKKLDVVIERQLQAGVEVHLHESASGSTRNLIEDDLLIVDGKVVSLSISGKEGDFRGVKLMWKPEKVEHYVGQHGALCGISRRREAAKASPAA